MLSSAEVLGDAARRVELGGVALSIPKRQRVAIKPFGVRDGEGGGGIEAAAQEDDGFWGAQHAES